MVGGRRGLRSLTNFKKNNPGCKCCTSCSICSDDWGSISNGSDISTGSNCGWTKDSGTWGVSSHQLQCTSSGVVSNNTTHPDSKPTMVVSADFQHSTSGSACDVIVGYVDSTHYYYARYTVAAGSGSIDIRRNNGGSHTSLRLISSVTMNTGTAYTAKVCVSQSGVISAYLNGTVKNSFIASPTGTKCGLGCTGSGTATFDNFSFSKGKNTSGAPTCEACSEVGDCPSFCNLGTVPGQIQVTLSGITGGGACCSPLNGTYILDFNISNLVQCSWVYTFPSTVCAGNGDFVQLFCNVTTGKLNVTLDDTTFHSFITWSAFITTPANCAFNQTLSFESRSSTTDCVGTSTAAVLSL